MPRIMAKMMLATTANSTSIHFGMGHQCQKHNQLFTLDHISECTELMNCEKIKEYANRLKVQHILEWEKEERTQAIEAYVRLV
jgi:hypothetical protein